MPPFVAAPVAAIIHSKSPVKDTDAPIVRRTSVPTKAPVKAAVVVPKAPLTPSKSPIKVAVEAPTAKKLKKMWTVWVAYRLSPHPMRHCWSYLGLVQELTVSV
jgi:hypothetical protein